MSLLAAPTHAGKTYATAASHAAHRAAAQQDDDKARSEAITDILAHRKWAAANVDTAFATDADLLRAAADAAATLSREPAYTAVLRKAAALVPALAAYASFRQTDSLDHADRRKTEALEAIALAAQKTVPQRPDVEARARYHIAVISVQTDAGRAYSSICDACRLAEKSRGGISKDRLTTETMLYNATRLFIKANYTEGDSPLLYAEESRLEHDFLRYFRGRKGTADDALTMSMLAMIRQGRGFGRESDEADVAEFGGSRPAELPDSVATAEWLLGRYYVKEAFRIASGALGYSHPDVMSMRLMTLAAGSPCFDSMFVYALAYWPLGTPMLCDVKIAKWTTALNEGTDVSESRKYATYLKYYRNYYGEDSRAYADMLQQVALIRLMDNIADGQPGDGSQLVELYIKLMNRTGRCDDRYIDACDGFMTLASFVDPKIYLRLSEEIMKCYAERSTQPSWTRVATGGKIATRLAQNAEHDKALDMQRKTVDEATMLPGTIGRRYEAKARYDLAVLYGSSGQPADSATVDSCWQAALKTYGEARLEKFMPAMSYAVHLADEYRLDDAAGVVTKLIKDDGKTMRKAYLASARTLLGRIRMMQGKNDRKTRRLFESAAEPLLTDTAQLPSLAVNGYLNLSAWHISENRPDSAEFYLQRGYLLAKKITDISPGFYLNFSKNLYTLYMALGQDHKAEELNESMIEELERDNMQGTTTYLDCMWNRVDITRLRTPGNLNKIFTQCTGIISPTFLVYKRGNYNKDIKYSYVLRLLTNIVTNGTRLYATTPAAAEQQDGAGNSREYISGQLGELIPQLLDMEQGYPGFVQGADYRVLPEYYMLIQALANYYGMVRDTSKITHYYRLMAEADSLCHRPWTAAQNMAGLYVMRGDFRSALPYNTECYRQLDRFSIFDQIQISRWQAELCYALNRDDEAVEAAAGYAGQIRRYVLSNFDYLGSDERAQFLADHSTSGLMINWMLPRKSRELAAQAYDAALFDKGLLLHSWERIRRSIIRSGDNALISQLDTLARLNEAARALNAGTGDTETSKQLSGIQQQIERIEKSLARSTEAYRTDTMRVVSWQEIRKALSPGEAAIEFVATDTAMAALIIKPGLERPAAVMLNGARQLTALLRQTDFMPAETRVRRLYTFGRSKLYDIIWRPLEQYLGNTATVYFSPTGELNRIAFAAIPVSADSCLIDRYDLRQLSTTAKLVSRAGKHDIKTATVFGGIYYSDGQAAQAAGNGSNNTRAAMQEAFVYLDETRRETDAIARCMAKADIKADTITGSNATETAFYKLDGQSTDIIHLATHGFFIDGSKDADEYAFLRNHPGSKHHAMQRTGLAFVGANTTWTGERKPDREDGILTANELSLLDLGNTDMAVLSACETALGSYTTEGVYGLQRGFKEAGVNTLMMSLWNVNDRATAIFMQDFYRLWLGGMTKREAFRTAVNNMRQQHREPFFWAAFTLLDAE